MLWLCLGLGTAIHLALTQVAGRGTRQQAARPLTTQFVKRQPRLTKPLELKKRPQPKRRAVQRTMVAVKARMQHAEGGVRFQPVQVLGGLARPAVQVGRAAAFASTELEPTSSAGAIEGAREVEQKIDMSLELLDIEALDTGKYNALVIEDPNDKRNIRGFCRLAVIYSEQFFDPAPNDWQGTFDMLVGFGFQRLVAFANEATDVKTESLGRVTLNDNLLFRVPWLLFSPVHTFQLSDSQRRNLGDYLLAGGFMFADGQDHPKLVPAWKAAFRSLRLALIGSLEECGALSSIEKLPNSHPVYHCYFDLDGPPIACDAIHNHEHPDLADVVGYAEGIEVGGRLLALVTGKGYCQAWCIVGPGGAYGGYEHWDPRPPFRFGVNTIILALTQEGSITNRLMDSVSH